MYTTCGSACPPTCELAARQLPPSARAPNGAMPRPSPTSKAAPLNVLPTGLTGDDLNPLCPVICLRPRCECADGYVRDVAGGDCIAVDECTATSSGKGGKSEGKSDGKKGKDDGKKGKSEGKSKGKDDGKSKGKDDGKKKKASPVTAAATAGTTASTSTTVVVAACGAVVVVAVGTMLIRRRWTAGHPAADDEAPEAAPEWDASAEATAEPVIG